MAAPARASRTDFEARVDQARALVAHIRSTGSVPEAEYQLVSALTRAYMEGLDEALRIFDRAAAKART